MQSDLIFDIGMHTGADTGRYLGMGFRVVAVEANPVLVDRAKVAFAQPIAEGRLVVEACGIHEVEGVLPFIVNDQVDEWSSFHENLGTRDGTLNHVINVPCHPLSYFVERHGMPFYMKIDVEGLDASVVRQLGVMKDRPRFVSIEDGGLDCMLAMFQAGVRKFKFSNQIEARERCGPDTSGEFGDDLPGDWLEPAEAFHFYLTSVRPPDQPPTNGWWDIHGKY